MEGNGSTMDVGPSGLPERPVVAPDAHATYRCGFDIGGTFTDLVLSGSDGSVFVGKVLTDPHDITGTIIEGLERLRRENGITPQHIHEVVAGATTFVTNLIIERKGAKTALITTAGFRDIIEIAREIRYDVYDLAACYPDPVVPRHLRFEVSERIDAAGAVLFPLDEQQVEAALTELTRKGAEALAVCFLHAFKNPAHEKRVREIAGRVSPRLAISLSSEVLPELREYERTIATALNAYAMPQARTYFAGIEQRLGENRSSSATLRIMQSNGGIISREIAERIPLRMLESGPAAGALAAAQLARHIELSQVLAFDMGGTTAKACLVSAGEPELTTEFETARVHRFKRGSGLPIRLPIIDLIEIGAGGGSIARVDTMGLLKVGPSSAGADPGPACYGIGGEDATVTDAAVVLGYLDPHGSLGGQVSINLELAREAVRRNVADQIGVDPVRAAAGIHRIVCEHMAAAAKIHAVEKGRDVRAYSLMAFGGAGPIHANAVARFTGCSQVIVPPNAGVFSALGLLAAPIKFDAVRSHYGRLSAMQWSDIEKLYEEMTKEGENNLISSGAEADTVICKRTADMRYVGQGFEISVPLPSSLSTRSEREITSGFVEVYRRKFGEHIPDGSIEVLNWRLEVFAGIQWPDVLRTANGPDAIGWRASRSAFFPEIDSFLETPVFRDPHFAARELRQGPVLIEQPGSTIVIGPRDRFQVDAFGNVIIAVTPRR